MRDKRLCIQALHAPENLEAMQQGLSGSWGLSHINGH